jgi:predicted deacylase
VSHKRSLITASVDLERSGVQRGHLRVPYSHDRSAYGYIPIPIWAALNGDGPTVLLTGGIHGDEYEGPLALLHFIQEFSLEHLRGRIIAIPALNYPAFVAATRTSPIDRLNLNRRFPGNRDGSPTDMIAHYVEIELMTIADYCFDFHAGGSSLNYLPTLIVDRPTTGAHSAVIDKLIEAFHPPRVLLMDMLGEDRVIAAAAHRHDVVFLTGEFGGGASVDLEGLRIVSTGLAGMLEALGVLSSTEKHEQRGNAAPIRRLSVRGPAHYLFASRSGIFEPRFRLGDDVREGQLAGYIHDPGAPWLAPEEVRFSGTGIVLCIRTFAQVTAGDCLGHLASDETLGVASQR